MADDGEAREVLREFWDRISARDWDGMAELLHPGLSARWVHTGETFDAAGLVRVNREYPGAWDVTVQDIVGAGERAVSRVRVTDGQQAYFAASFASVRGGLITDLVEVWTESAAPPPGRRGPGG